MIVCLISGPRSGGKSTFVDSIKASNPEITILSRDQFFIQKFGDTSFNPYDGSGYVAANLFDELIKETVTAADNNAKIIIDAWNGYLSDRQHYLRLLKDLKVDVVICWRIVVPLSTCLKWYKHKLDYCNRSEYSVKSDYNLYYQNSIDIIDPEEFYERCEQSGKKYHRFDAIYEINPLQLRLPGISPI